MSELLKAVQNIDLSASRPKHLMFNDLVKVSHAFGLVIDDVDINKPWGFYIRFESQNTEEFVRAFFPGLSIEEAKLGIPDASISPKFLVVVPGEMFSWQYHERRAERWSFLTNSSYYKSQNNDKGDLIEAKPGDIVQFQKGERHQMLAPHGDTYALAAEIWQHIDPNHLSEESDIVRLEDKYNR